MTPPPHTWIFASAGSNQITTETNGKIGLFTRALIDTLPQHGLDLTELASRVKNLVAITIDKDAQHPQSWSSDPPRFFFHESDPAGERINSNDRLPYVYIPAGKFWMGCVPASNRSVALTRSPGILWRSRRDSGWVRRKSHTSL